MIKASEVRVWNDDGELLSGDARDAALAEYRTTGGMVGAWLVDPSGATTPEERDALAEEGPRVDEIDWTADEGAHDAAWVDVARRRLADADAGTAKTLTLDEVKARLAGRTFPGMTDAEKREQRISFVYGNVSLSNPNVTREMVERLVDEEDRER